MILINEIKVKTINLIKWYYFINTSPPIFIHSFWETRYLYRCSSWSNETKRYHYRICCLVCLKIMSCFKRLGKQFDMLKIQRTQAQQANKSHLIIKIKRSGRHSYLLFIFFLYRITERCIFILKSSLLC